MRFQLFEFAALSWTTQFLKPLSSSVGAQLSSCGSAVDSSHLIVSILVLHVLEITSFWLTEINKSYFKLVQLWWTHNLSIWVYLMAQPQKNLTRNWNQRLTERTKWLTEQTTHGLLWFDWILANDLTNVWKLQKVLSELKTNDRLIFFFLGEINREERPGGWPDRRPRHVLKSITIIRGTCWIWHASQK